MSYVRARLGTFGWLALVLVLLANVQLSYAQRALPVLASRVTDEIGLLPPTDRAALETQLQQFEAAKGSQVAVVIVGSTEPEDIAQFGIRLGDKWKLGRKGVDDGAILIVAISDKKMRIEVGYGLEGALPDATCKQIIEDIIKPSFRSGNFPEGIQLGVQAIIARISGEPLPAPKSSGSSQVVTILVLIFLGLAVLVLISAMQGGAYGLNSYPGGQRRYGSSSWGGGGGGFSSGGGGGFSGGGGSFGGGGASGGW